MKRCEEKVPSLIDLNISPSKTGQIIDAFEEKIPLNDRSFTPENPIDSLSSLIIIGKSF
jgi:hypothetical protein